MKYKAIFFDLDGTLLPCDIDVFTKAYFTELAKVLAPYGYEKDELVAAIWGGTKLMYKNDGSKSNCDVFWECFAKSAKGDVAKAKEQIARLEERGFAYYYNAERSTELQPLGENM